MYKFKHVLLVGSILLIATALFTFSPGLGTAHAAGPSPSAIVSYANSTWNCLDVFCTEKVKAGAAQPNYECAEFVARDIAWAEYIPDLGGASPQSEFDPYYVAGYTKHHYDLLLITPTSGLYTLADFLIDQGVGVNIGTNLSKMAAGDVVVFEDSNHVAQHTAVIVVKGSSTSKTLVDAHNSARYHVSISFYLGEFPYWYMIHIV
ncbi:MAG: amidase domain-containing protein [Ktedonobacterales bacterium]